MNDFGIYGCIAFSVFCEIHGPAVIMCTQGIQHKENKSGSIASYLSDMKINDKNLNKGNDKEETDNSNINHNNDEQGNLKVNINLVNNETKINQNDPSFVNSEQSSSKVCAGCSPFFPGSSEEPLVLKHGYETFDPEANMWYYSGRYPFASNTYSSIRQICVRSLSCEFCPGREGPILFGDERSGYALCYLFKLKDSQARGSLRWYCFVIMNRDLSFLVASWPFLVSKFRHIALRLQQTAEETFINDKQNMNRGLTGAFGLSTPESFLRKRGTQILRPLTELLHDNFLFTKLHMHFSWILKAYGNRVIEHHSDGKYLMGTFAQDLHEDKNTRESIPADNLQDLAKIFGLNILLNIVYELMIGNQVVIRGRDNKFISSIVNIFKLFIASVCANIIPYSTVYEEIWKATLLGLDEQVKIPDDVDTSQIVLIDLIKEETQTNYYIKEHTITFGSWQTQGSDYIENIRKLFVLHGESDVILNDLVFLKEKWLHKSKLMFAYQKHGIQGKEGPLLRLLGCKSGDVPILKFMMKGIDSSTRKSILEMGTSSKKKHI